MDPVSYAIKKPVTVAVGVILVLMFGIISMLSLPVQLTPDVEEPQITIRTNWGGATPYDIEQEVIESQEEALKGVRNLVKMESSSFNDYGQINLTFKVGTDLQDALVRVSNKLDEVSDYPDNVDNPVIDAAGANSSPVIWLMMKMKEGDPEDIRKYRTFFEDEVRQHLERVNGVGSLFIGGGTKSELHIVVDIAKMARHRISIGEVIEKIQGANANTSAGVMEVGKKDYRLRTTAKFNSPEDPLDVMIYDDGVKRIRLRDIARVETGYERESVSVSSRMGQASPSEGVVVGVRKESGANVLELIANLKAAVKELNEGLLAENGLYFQWNYDEAPYINTAIDIVRKNVFIGGMLAIAVLLIFLRSASATFTTALAIPISAMSTFMSLRIFDRNLNVVSLAGISFAVGMLVDNAIVVLENIDRHRSMGKKAFPAALDGTREVIGAVFASTATTVAVFLPVLFIEEEAGQLFKDIAIAIAFSIMVSLIVSTTVIPSALHQIYKRRPRRTGQKKTGLIDRVGGFFAGIIMAISRFFLTSFATRIFCVLLFTSLSLGTAWMLLPQTEYLPQGNRNFILSILVPPSGSSVVKRKAIGDVIYNGAAPYFEAGGKDGLPQLSQIFYVAAPNLTLAGVMTTEDTRAPEIIPLFNRLIYSIPDMVGVSLQVGIFQRDIGGDRAVDVNITGESIPDIIAAGRALYGAISQKLPGCQIRPIPSLDISYPEAAIVPDKVRLAANGLTERDLGVYADVIMDGRKIGEYQPDGARKIDLVITGDKRVYQSPEDVLDGQIVNRFGDLIRIGDVARMEYSQGMTQVNHLERRRSITLQVTPARGYALQTAAETIRTEVVAPMGAAGQLPDVRCVVGGNASRLEQTRMALQWNFLLAVGITYLLMAALFENFFYPFIILFTVPLAAAGGFIGLKLVNIFITPQSFDILTMLGFIILVGAVVNNAILIVHQALNNVRYGGLKGVDAVVDSVRTRIRPIFMSTATSVFGLSPMVLATGSGSELYRGLGSVLLGGLALSTLLTLFVIPSLLAFFIGFEKEKTDEIEASAETAI